MRRRKETVSKMNRKKGAGYKKKKSRLGLAKILDAECSSIDIVVGRREMKGKKQKSK